MTDISELERKALEARSGGVAVMLSPDEVEGIVYWLRSLHRQRQYWADLFMSRRLYRMGAWLRRRGVRRFALSSRELALLRDRRRG